MTSLALARPVLSSRPFPTPAATAAMNARPVDRSVALRADAAASEPSAGPRRVGEQTSRDARARFQAESFAIAARHDSVQGAGLALVRSPFEQAAARAGSVERPAPAPAPALGDRLAAGARAQRGQSTRSGPAGGRLACAFAVNRVLRQQGIAPIGANPNYVPSMEADLKARVRAGTAVAVPAGHAQPGDIVIARDQSHIGIAIGGGRVLSNSSSRRSFSWESGMNFDGSYGGGPSRVYRLLPSS